MLAAIGPDVTRAINFGMFAVIVVPLLKSLKWINGYVANYGWAIIILTVMINVIIFPLRHKSVVSMRKMQEIQPAGEGDSGPVREAQGHRSGQTEDEPRIDVALQRARRQSGQRLRARFC